MTMVPSTTTYPNSLEPPPDYQYAISTNSTDPFSVKSMPPNFDRTMTGGSDISTTSFTTSASSVSTSSPVNSVAVKVKLYNNKKEREYYDNLSNLFSIIKTTEALEKLFSCNAFPAADYKRECSLLISHFKRAQQLTGLLTPEQIQQFMTDYSMDCKMAFVRLVEVGVPHCGGSGDMKAVAETVQHFITLMDSLKLQMVAVDEIFPLIQDLVDSANRSLVTFAGHDRLQNWFTQLNAMKASEELNPDQIRQMSHDLEVAYNNFHKNLLQ